MGDARPRPAREGCEAGELVSGVVLAGGRSERLGRDKAGLLLGRETLLQRVVRTLSCLSDDLIAVVRADQQVVVPEARVVQDVAPYSGVLAGMAAGLTAARHDWALVVACDMPFLNLGLLRYMLSLRCEVDVVVPRLDVGAEPLHALYHKRCLGALSKSLAEGRRRVISFYDTLRVRWVDPEEIARFDSQGRSFFNINTPDDLALAQSWLEEHSPGA